MSPAIKYTLARVGIFVVLLAALLPLRLNLFLTMMLALVVSLPLSYLLLRRWRDQLAEHIEGSVRRRKQQRERLRAALSGDDDPTYADDAPPRTSAKADK